MRCRLTMTLRADAARAWHRPHQDDGIEGLARFGHEGSACRLSQARQERVKPWIAETLPRTTRETGAWIGRERGIDCQGGLA